MPNSNAIQINAPPSRLLVTAQSVEESLGYRKRLSEERFRNRRSEERETRGVQSKGSVQQL